MQVVALDVRVRRHRTSMWHSYGTMTSSVRPY